MYLVRTPALAKPLYRDLLWHLPRTGNKVYLTFDDGPEPAVTPWVLDQLAAHGMKGTFFCVGRNAAAHPALVERIIREGHAVGNHTWDHARGWGSPDRSYLRSVLQCDALLRTRLFRPPYGRITRSQAACLRKRFKLVMWDVLSADFDEALTGKHCAANVLEHVRPGSIVVFHDSRKAEARLREALPVVLQELTLRGLLSAALPNGV
jgi:peptidoglycan/xylan/chitin deacetylase (PgdA/CDA1 family)